MSQQKDTCSKCNRELVIVFYGFTNPFSIICPDCLEQIRSESKVLEVSN